MSDINKRESISLSLPKYLCDKLRDLDNRSGLVRELLIENLTRVTNGDLAQAQKIRQAHVLDMIGEALEEMNPKFKETAQSALASSENVRRLQEIEAMVKGISDELSGVVHKSKESQSSLTNTKAGEELASILANLVVGKLNELEEILYE